MSEAALRLRGVACQARIRPLDPTHRHAVEGILRSTPLFRPAEVDVALEVLDSYFLSPDRDYHALGAFTPGGGLAGYVCFGPAPCTVGTWDLYWIAVAPELRGAGIGSILLQEVEGRLTRFDARVVIIETSSRPDYEATRGFYGRRGYREVARVPDYYEPGDDRVIFARRIER